MELFIIPQACNFLTFPLQYVFKNFTGFIGCQEINMGVYKEV